MFKMILMRLFKSWQRKSSATADCIMQMKTFNCSKIELQFEPKLTIKSLNLSSSRNAHHLSVNYESSSNFFLENGKFSFSNFHNFPFHPQLYFDGPKCFFPLPTACGTVEILCRAFRISNSSRNVGKVSEGRFVFSCFMG